MGDDATLIEKEIHHKSRQCPVFTSHCGTVHKEGEESHTSACVRSFCINIEYLVHRQLKRQLHFSFVLLIKACQALEEHSLQKGPAKVSMFRVSTK